MSLFGTLEQGILRDQCTTRFKLMCSLQQANASENYIQYYPIQAYPKAALPRLQPNPARSSSLLRNSRTKWTVSSICHSKQLWQSQARFALASQRLPAISSSQASGGTGPIRIHSATTTHLPSCPGTSSYAAYFLSDKRIGNDGIILSSESMRISEFVNGLSNANSGGMLVSCLTRCLHCSRMNH